MRSKKMSRDLFEELKKSPKALLRTLEAEKAKAKALAKDVETEQSKSIAAPKHGIYSHWGSEQKLAQVIKVMNELATEYIRLKDMKDALERQIMGDKAYNAQRTRPGYIYILQSSEGFYKIGRSGNPEQRFENQLPDIPNRPTLTLIYSVQVKDMVDTETYLHHLFQQQRIKKEWFALSEEDVEWLKSLDGEMLDSLTDMDKAV